MARDRQKGQPRSRTAKSRMRLGYAGNDAARIAGGEFVPDLIAPKR